ncbi:hypothetical protein ACE7GA_24425 [Roseomonas sp. CCTCC AB2023176]|uniref:hypothetical protein n=1 Tax=Roseomonas sp. CCTCC AB2023176 TaxID=3342640 RepID=UPI0035D92F59
MRRRTLLTAALLLPACAELRRSNQPLPPPAGLLPTNADPGRAAIALLDRDARGASLGIARDPTRAARVASVLEWLAADIAGQPRWAPLSRGTKEGIGTARNETRAAIGVDALAPAGPLIQALAAASRALGAGNRGAALAALPVSLFPRGAEAALDRLSNTGPLPALELGVNALTEEVRLLDATNGWLARPESPVPPDRGGLGGSDANVDNLGR